MSNNKSFLQESFEEVFVSVRQVPFQEKWRERSYMNHACKYELAPGQIVCAHSEFPDNRRMLLIGTRVGTAVIFERFSANPDEVFVLVSNAPSSLRFILPSGEIGERTFLNVVNPGKPADNMGSRLEALFNGKSDTDLIV